jgi:hypothetical protein
VEGYVYNNSEYRVTNVHLDIEVVETATDRVIGHETAWVLGSIDARSRGYFIVRRPPRGHTYRIRVDGFDLVSRQAP